METTFLGGTGANKPPNRADDDEEFFVLVRKVLNSPPVISAAQSLIARASEALEETEVNTAEPSGLTESAERISVEEQETLE